MSQDCRSDLIKYRLKRAEETYKEALLMKEANHWNACANRLYYACFYAVIALLEKNDYASSKHSGVKSIFNKNFVKTGLISKDQGELYNNLFDSRQEGDYVDFVFFKAPDIEPWLPKVKEFIANISKLIEK
ncbi:HEPN domain-containing protein [candidate division KSB1 bacterium]|nr:HEPN domain-containing protein [candidate division KSB1 bacterium]MBL7095288.1 HEPN domain-containing protein [candidate division KSB1 bacterium]